MSELREVWLVIRRYEENINGDDYTDEVVIAVYPGEAEAEQHAVMAEEAIPEYLTPEGWDRFRNPYDPSLRVSEYSSLLYSYRSSKAPFALHVDQFLERVPE